MPPQTCRITNIKIYAYPTIRWLRNSVRSSMAGSPLFTGNIPGEYGSLKLFDHSQPWGMAPTATPHARLAFDLVSKGMSPSHPVDDYDLAWKAMTLGYYWGTPILGNPWKSPDGLYAMILSESQEFTRKMACKGMCRKCTSKCATQNGASQNSTGQCFRDSTINHRPSPVGLSQLGTQTPEFPS